MKNKPCKHEYTIGDNCVNCSVNNISNNMPVEKTEDLIDRVHRETFPEQYREKTVEELFEEYAEVEFKNYPYGKYDDESADKRKQQIISEVKSQVRREVVEEIYNLFPRPMWTVSANSIKEYALSNGITLKN